MSGTYLIAEIGQNHNGSLALAKALIDIISFCDVTEDVRKREGLEESGFLGFNAIKFTKRDLSIEMTASMMKSPYLGRHSFGKTYAEHREALELSDDEHHELYKHTKSLGFDYIITLCSASCLSILELFTPDKLKVASRDLSNIRLLSALSETKIPIIISTGMSSIEDVDRAISTISRYHSNISILHCVSRYPCEASNHNLLSIRYLQDHYDGMYEIGYSDHSVGILAPPLAVVLGAKIIEKHVTLSSSLPGTDQKGSLSEDGLRRMVRDVRIAELSRGVYRKDESTVAYEARRKLERSICAARNLPEGHCIKEEDIVYLSPGTGIKSTEEGLVIGRLLKKPVDMHEFILMTDLHD